MECLGRGHNCLLCLASETKSRSQSTNAYADVLGHRNSEEHRFLSCFSVNAVLLIPFQNFFNGTVRVAYLSQPSFKIIKSFNVQAGTQSRKTFGRTSYLSFNLPSDISLCTFERSHSHFVIAGRTLSFRSQTFWP